MEREHKCLICGCDLKVCGIHDGVNTYKFHEDKAGLFNTFGDYTIEDNYEGDKVDILPSNHYLNTFFYCNNCNNKIGTVDSVQSYLNTIIIPF